MELRIWLKPSFKTVAKETALAAVLWPAIFLAAYAAWPPGPQLASRSDRVAAALQLLPYPALLLLLMVLACSRILDTPGAQDPFAAAESKRFKINARVITNTVEQLSIFLPLLLALSAVVPASSARLLPVLVLLFVLGRILFWIGIHVQLLYRVLGYEITVFTHVATAFCFAYFKLQADGP